MVETWRWPKASESVESMARAETPRREAVSRSMTRWASRPWSCWSVATSRSSGSCCMAAMSCGDQVSRSSCVSAVRVYWYCVAEERPPMLSSCEELQVELHAGHVGGLGAESIDDRVGGQALLEALVAGLEGDEHARRVGGSAAGAAAAEEAEDVLHAGLLLDDLRDLRHGARGFRGRRCPAGSASVPPRRPVSCRGKKPLGTMMKR